GAEVQPHVSGTFGTESRAVVEGDLRLAEDALGRVIAPAECGEIDPGEVAGLRRQVPRLREVFAQQRADQTAVLVERAQKSVQPLVAFRAERGRGREQSEQPGSPLDFDGQITDKAG